MRQLLEALKRIMEPPMEKKRPLRWRSAPILREIKHKAANPKPTEEELQYLTFFTKYCAKDDFLEYRSQFLDESRSKIDSKSREDVHTDVILDDERNETTDENQ